MMRSEVHFRASPTVTLVVVASLRASCHIVKHDVTTITSPTDRNTSATFVNGTFEEATLCTIKVGAHRTHSSAISI